MDQYQFIDTNFAVSERGTGEVATAIIITVFMAAKLMVTSHTEQGI